MPPYHADATIGIQDYKNDIRLSKEEINTIVQWVDSGTPEGDPADLPPPVSGQRGTNGFLKPSSVLRMWCSRRIRSRSVD